MAVSECDTYINTIDVIEEAIVDDTKFPTIKDNKVKTCCHMTLELAKIVINYIKMNINGTQNKKKH